MDMAKLQELLDLHHDKNVNRELNKEERALYARLLFQILQENGLTPEAIRYIWGLPLLGGLEGFYLWRKMLDEHGAEKAYDLLFDSKAFTSMNSSQKVKALLLLLADEIVESECNAEVIRRLIWHFVNDSYTKGGERVGDLSVSFKNYFLKKIDQNTQLPNLKELQFSEEYTKEILDLFMEAAKGVKVSGKKEEENRTFIVQWIEENNIFGGEYLVEDIVSLKELQKEEKKKQEKKKKNSAKNSLGRLAKSLSDISLAVNILEETVQQQSYELEKNKNTIVALKKDGEIDQRRIESLEKENTELKDSLNLCRQDFENAKSEKQALEERVSRQASVLNVYTEDKEKSQTEQLNSIAASLVKYYKDFELAKSMELTTDIEMTLLDLLEDIFKRLEKNGIDIKGRI